MRSASRFLSRNVNTTVSNSVWISLVPKFLRRRPAKKTTTSGLSRAGQWNPATFFIISFLLIGSNAIQMIALRRDNLGFSRKAETRIGTLKEAIERIGKGEKVDVKKLLGTGDETQEDEWAQVIEELSAIDGKIPDIDEEEPLPDTRPLEESPNLQDHERHGERNLADKSDRFL